MENEFLNKVEDNAAICAWSEKLQSEKGDSLSEGYTSELQEFTRVCVAQNELQELRDIWARWDEGTKQFFYQSCGDISYLLDIRVDKHLFRVMVQFWNSAYKCFTFGEVDLVPTLEEYTTLFRDERALGHCSDSTKMALRYVDEAVTDLFDHLEKGITPVPAILAETFRSLSLCRKTGEGRFIGCAQLLFPVKRGGSHTKERGYLRGEVDGSLPKPQGGDIEWRAYWLVPDEIMYRCGNFDWVPLLGIWGATGYTPLLALR
ncbi:hypothetical protein CXB51_026438 [Gossypium anomalum]|uniref:DUF7745 domain-containing protein n=1 Tax=Gossypium anomalum TaxID=47600 RepID=A0A8J5YL50_9ROSI|nr:hypothetical protein CXB51_026438 [Gossypium anomalum]